jgi:hypothetical protein
MSFRRPNPSPSPSRWPSPRNPGRSAMSTDISASTALDEPLRGVKAGRMTVLPFGVAFTALHAGPTPGSPVAYAPLAEMTCLCGYAEQPGIMGVGRYGRWHERPDRNDGHCGFYAWKPGQPFPWTVGTWLLEVDLYGRVVEHERGYRAQKQRVLRISPVPDSFCEPPFMLSYQPGDGHVTAVCAACPPPRAPGHPVSVDRLRQLLNVEIDLGRAWRLREDTRHS